MNSEATYKVGDNIPLSELANIVLHPDSTYLLGDDTQQRAWHYTTTVPDTVSIVEGKLTWPPGTRVTILQVLYARRFNGSEYVIELVSI